MSFLALSAFAFLALCPVIVFLYFLKLRRSEHVISSTMLWRKSIDDMRANAPFQRLRRNLLMILQLLIVAFLVFALARPFLASSPVKGRSVILLVDHSASMNVADENGKTRLERARELGREIVGQVRAGPLVGDRSPGVARAMVISFGDRASIRSTFGDDRRVLERALADIEPTDTGTSLRDALALALNSVGEAESPEIVVLSDGAFEPVTDVSASAGQGVPIRYLRVGSSDDNVGIVALNVRRQVEGGRGFEVFVSVHNYRSAPARVTVDLFLDDRLLDARQLTVAARSAEAAVFRHYRDATGVLRAQLDVEDGLQADNVAYAVLGEERMLKALLFSEGNFFLEKALALDPMLELERADPSTLGPKPPAGYDFVVFDNCAPKELTPGAYLFIHAPPPLPGVEQGPPATQPALVDWDPTHPVTRFLGFGSVYVHRTATAKLPKAFQTLLDSTAGPLLAAYETGDTRLLYLAFDPYDSTWPFRVSFPVFVTNAGQWLARSGEQGPGHDVKTGQSRSLRPAVAKDTVTIRDPRGESHLVSVGADGQAVFADTRWVGLYEIDPRAPEARTARTFAANLLDARESDIGPRQHMEVNRTRIERASEKVVQKDVWARFLLVALVLLMVEWAVYNRRLGV